MQSHYLLLCLLMMVMVMYKVEGKILKECEAAKALRDAKLQDTSLNSHWICLMKSVSGLNTSLVKGPGSHSSFSHGVFQINSYKWCKRGRKGGDCNAKCEDFINDDISDDIACAEKIFKAEGFKHWTEWMKKCKGTTPPNVLPCNSRFIRQNPLQRLINFFRSDVKR